MQTPCIAFAVCRVEFLELVIGESRQGVPSDGGKENEVLDKLKKEDLTTEHFPLFPEHQKCEKTYIYEH